MILLQFVELISFNLSAVSVKDSNICVTNDHGYVPLVVNNFSVLSSFLTYHRVSGAPEWYAVPAPLMTLVRRVNLATNPVISQE
jgi:hypothetical protein